MITKPSRPCSAGRGAVFDDVGTAGGAGRGVGARLLGPAVEKPGSSIIVPRTGVLTWPTGRISLATGGRCGCAVVIGCGVATARGAATGGL